jgi:hypothetical protein
MKTSFKRLLPQSPRRMQASLKRLPLLLLLTLPAVVQAQLTYTTNNGAITITGCLYNGSVTNVTIPSTINGLPVTSIGSEAFGSCLELTNVTIPDSVTSIGANAFSGDYFLVNVSLGNSLASIGNYVFQNCTRLTSITFPISLTSIGTNALTDLRSVYFEGNAPNVGAGAFNDLYATVYYVPNTTGWGATFGGCPTAPWWPYTYTTNNAAITLTGYTGLGGAVGLPGTINGLPVTGIADAAFAACALTSVTIPDSVTSLGVSAFSSCTSLASVTIGGGVTNLADNAFSFCASLTNVTIGSGVTNLGACAFLSCPSLNAVFFQGNAPGADSSAFHDDSHATVYYLPGTTGWTSPFGGRPAVLWNPQVQTGGPSFGVRTNQFGFTVTGASNLVIVVEACTNLAHPAWSPLQTNTLTRGSSSFSDPQWTNCPARFYRLRSP